MTYWRLAAVVAFSSFALVSIGLSVFVSVLYPAAQRVFTRLGARRRAAALWHLRVAPGSAAFLIAFGFALPTFLAFEPRDTQESVSVTLAAAAAVGVVLLVFAGVRGLRAWLATRALERRWLARAGVWAGEAPLPVRVIDGEFPTVAVLGVVAPRLYVAERVLAECPAQEIRAMFAHELAHVASRDNLKRFAMRVCPDVLWVRRPLERAWAAAAEEAADAAATQTSPEKRLDLAQALLRVARLAPQAPAYASISAFYLGGSIDTRVRRLLEGQDPSVPSRAWPYLACAAAAVVAAAFIAAAPTLHQSMESLVHYLP